MCWCYWYSIDDMNNQDLICHACRMNKLWKVKVIVKYEHY